MKWLFDRWWLWKNQAAMQQLDAEMDALHAEGERLERRMLETFGPDWRIEGEERLKRALCGVYTLT